MYAVQMDIQTLTDFLNDQMIQRQMSARQFAEFVGVNHALINKFRNNVPSEEVGYPAMHTLKKISDATGVSLLSLISLTFPDVKNIGGSIEARVLAEQFSQLAPDDQAVARGFIRDALSKSKKK